MRRRRRPVVAEAPAGLAGFDAAAWPGVRAWQTARREWCREAGYAYPCGPAGSPPGPLGDPVGMLAAEREARLLTAG